MQDLFDAVNIAGVNTNVTTLMTGFIAVTLLFFGYGIVRKLLRRGV